MPGLEAEVTEKSETEEEGINTTIEPDDSGDVTIGDAHESMYESAADDSFKRVEEEEDSEKEETKMVYILHEIPGAVEKFKNGNMKIKQKQNISYEYEGECERAYVVSSSGKKTGEFANRFNLTLGSSRQDHRVQLDEVENVEVLEWEKLGIYYESDLDTQLVFNTKIPEREDPGILAAKDGEINQLRKFDVFEEVKDMGQKKISTTWVITERVKGTGKVFKARLCCRGYEENIGADLSVESPTTEKVSIRIFLALCAIKQWNVRSLDIKAAFLQSDEIGRNIFVQPPRGYKREGTIWRLKRPLYGLNDAGRQWYFTLKDFLKTLGFTTSPYDKAMFYLIKDGKLQGIMNVHVDDIIWGGNCKFQEAMKQIGKKFELSKSAEGALRYVGIDIGYLEESRELTMSQKSYQVEVDKAVKEQIKDADDKTELIRDLLTAYQSAVGKLNWLACNTRPDLKALVFKYSSSTPPRVADLRAVFFLFKYYFTSVVHTAMIATLGNRPITGAEGSYNKASED